MKGPDSNSSYVVFENAEKSVIVKELDEKLSCPHDGSKFCVHMVVAESFDKYSLLRDQFRNYKSGRVKKGCHLLSTDP